MLLRNAPTESTMGRFRTGGGQIWEQIHARNTMELELCDPISKGGAPEVAWA